MGSENQSGFFSNLNISTKLVLSFGIITTIFMTTFSLVQWQDSFAWASLVIGGVFALGVMVFTIRSISSPAHEISTVLSTLTEGNTSVSFTGLNREDEFGQISRAANLLLEKFLEIEQIQENVKNSDANDLKQSEEQSQSIRTEEDAKITEQKRLAQETEERVKQASALCRDFENVVDETLNHFATATERMSTSASQMANNAEQTNQHTGIMSDASEEAAANVQSVSAATEELSTSIKEIERQADKSSTIAKRAVHEADNTNETMTSLAEAAQKIGDVIVLINDIANQTNLLALNATIEAARAGEAGKGFAVVATEVKSLAEQTARATEDISSHVSAMQGTTDEAVKAIQEIGTTIREVEEIASSISAAVEQQGAATNEIANSGLKAANRTNEVSSSISSVTHAAQETRQGADEVLTASRELAVQSDHLRENVNNFIEGIRAI